MLLPMTVADVAHASPRGINCSYPVFTSTPFVLPACPDRVPRPTVLPPVQSSDCDRLPEETGSSEGVAGSGSCENEDDSAPPIVRFKNRYRRAIQQEVQQHQQQQPQQGQCFKTLRDWNHNETAKLHEAKNDYSPLDGHYFPLEYVPASSDALVLGERRAVVDETRACEKRTWSRITPEVDCSDPWMSASKISCRDTTWDSTRTEVYHQLKQPTSDGLPERYQDTHRRSFEQQNCITERRELKCKPHVMFVIVIVFHKFWHVQRTQ